MAEGDLTIFQQFITASLRAEINISSGQTIQCVLLDSGYTLDASSHSTFADASANEYATGSNYSSGGEALTSPALTYDSDTGVTTWDAADVTWSSLGPLSPATPSHALLINAGAADSDILIAHIALGTTATNGGDYSLTWSSDGIISSS